MYTEENLQRKIKLQRKLHAMKEVNDELAGECTQVVHLACSANLI